MADYEFPPDLIEAQRAFWLAETRCSAAYAALPSSVSIAAKEADVTEEQQRELDDALAERGRWLDVLYEPTFWQTVDDPHTARMKLWAAARA